MSLAKALSTPPPVVAKGPTCGIGRLLISLPDADAEALRKALADPAWRTRSLHDTLKAEGFAVAYTSVVRHRKGQCQCAALGAS